MEKGAIEKGIEQLVKVEQSTDLSLERIKEQYFDIDTNSPNIPVIVPTKAQSKCMMRCKGKKLVEEGVSSAKVTKKWALAEGNEITKMLQWIRMGTKERQWVEQVGLGGLFIIHYIVPWTDLLREFLHTWEYIEDGQIQAIVCGKKITINQVLFAQQFGVWDEGMVDAANALVT